MGRWVVVGWVANPSHAHGIVGQADGLAGKLLIAICYAVRVESTLAFC